MNHSSNFNLQKILNVCSRDSKTHKCCYKFCTVSTVVLYILFSIHKYFCYFPWPCSYSRSHSSLIRHTTPLSVCTTNFLHFILLFFHTIQTWYFFIRQHQINCQKSLTLLPFAVTLCTKQFTSTALKFFYWNSLFCRSLHTFMVLKGQFKEFSRFVVLILELFTHLNKSEWR